ncbi:hypothetical protein K469DRAFT_553600, partial [Zopfia rhizophila CBS 207.26]
QTSRVKIKIGANEYLVDIKKIPYFESFVRFQRCSSQSTTSLPVHSDIPFFDIINHGVQEGYRHFFRRLRGVARDAAFRLLYLFVLGEFESDVRDSSMAYNAVLFIVSHRGIFKHRTRKMVREAFEERFELSEKQRKGLDKWPINETQEEGWQEDDVTTEEEIPDFDSDWSM